MSKQSFSHLAIATLLSSLVFLGIFFWWTQHRKDRDIQAILSFEEQKFLLEVSATPELRRLGLGNRESLCGNCGMLFLFEKPDQYGFWMKDMQFPIDIVWLLGDEVIQVARSVPMDSPQTYLPKRAADRVIELNAGKADSLKEGDRVDLWIP